MAEVHIQDGETLESALRRFKRKVQQEDIIKEIKRHSFYLKPGEKRRTKEALAAKKALGIPLGKPKGTLQASIYDTDRQRIVELLHLGVSARHISTHHLKYGSISGLNSYIKTRHLR